ncbi:MAG: prepilin-type N-terminal cleavage/methylation domain-containing protein [Alphaproteobacteria bacterium]|nr:prepilin-type N-terminal cleavage/methylation domain-containing protein [Alphaproteobacteria bacterium]
MSAAGRRRRGMTIIEVMLALAILIIITMVGWASVDGAIEMNDALARTDETTRTARVALARLRRELQLAYLTPNRAAVATYFTFFVGHNDDPDRVWFTSLSHKRLYLDSREADQAEYTVWVERSPSELEPGDVLYHRESRRIDEEPSEGGRVWPLAYHVQSFELRYLNGRLNEWVDEWDTRAGETPYQLPRAVQIGLVLLAPDPDDPDRSVEVPFVTTTLLQYADPVTPTAGRTVDQ